MVEQKIIEIIEKDIGTVGSDCTKIIIEVDTTTCESTAEIISLLNQKYQKFIEEKMKIEDYKLKTTLRFTKTEYAKTCFKKLIEKGCHVEDHGILQEKTHNKLEAPSSLGSLCFIINLS